MKKFLKTKVGLAVFLMLLSTVFPTVFDCFAWLFIRKNFLRGWVVLFLLFGAPVFLAGVFILLGIAKDHESHAAAGFYYGGAVLTALIQSRHSTVDEYLIGFGLAAVIVYLVITRHRPKDE